MIEPPIPAKFIPDVRKHTAMAEQTPISTSKVVPDDATSLFEEKKKLTEDPDMVEIEFVSPSA